MSIFHQQQLFMTATEQAPNAPLYRELVKEEVEEELEEAWEKFSHAPTFDNEAELADAIMDSLYVLAGMANSLWGADKALTMFEEVHRSNMSKVVPVETLEGIKYAVKRRDDGKIEKPSSFSPPNLLKIVSGF
jgi:predicted HAD superfamily Cof-like phosphohydrolase